MFIYKFKLLSCNKGYFAERHICQRTKNWKRKKANPGHWWCDCGRTSKITAFPIPRFSIHTSRWLAQWNHEKVLFAEEARLRYQNSKFAEIFSNDFWWRFLTLVIIEFYFPLRCMRNSSLGSRISYVRCVCAEAHQKEPIDEKRWR